MNDLALAQHLDVDGLADRGRGDHPRQAAHGLTSLPSNFRITSLGWMPASAAGLSGVTLATSAPRLLQAQALGDLVGDVLDMHAEPAAPRLAELPQLIDDLHGAVRGHGKADADRAAGRRDDGGVHADDLAVHVEQRAAGIALVDGGVGLQEVVVGPGVDVALAWPR